MPPLNDTSYLTGLVGEALARGCAATVTALPNDPVEYLGQWLLRYVKNVEVVGEYQQDKESELQARKAQLEAEADAAVKLKAAQQVKADAVIELSKTVDEPGALLQKAVDLIVRFTNAGAAYAATVAEQEEPDWVYPEDVDDPAAEESEDEADPTNPGADSAAPTAPAAEASQGEGSVADAGSASAPKVPRPIDYSKCYLSYLAGSAGQEFMRTTELHRPVAAAGYEDPDVKPAPMPFTFRILDERRPMVYCPNVAFEPSVTFFQGFPKVGAYQACGVQSPATGEFKAVVAADTLFPEAGGQPLNQEDQDFIWHVSRALSQAYEAVEQQHKAGLEGLIATEHMTQLQQAIRDIYFPPPSDDGGTPGAAAVPAAASVAGDAEGQGEAEGGDSDEDPVAILRAEVKDLAQQLHEAEVAREQAVHSLETSQQVLTAIKDAVLAQAGRVVPVLRHTRVVPQATFHVLKAVLHVLGKEPASFSNWKRAFAHFHPALFDELHEFDASQERDAARWKAARCCYKGLPEDPKEATAKLESEMPESHWGVLLHMWLKEVRKVGRRAAGFRACRVAEDLLHEQLEAKKIELEAAEKLKADEDEAARKAAEEAAAAGEGGEEGEEEDE